MSMSLLPLIITVCVLIVVILCPTILAHDDANQVLAKFKSAREARQKEKVGKIAMAIPDMKQNDMDFETRRAALLAQAELNIPAERDLEWEKQLQEDRRSIYYDQDRSIMDDPNHFITTDPAFSPHVAGIRPADL